MKIETRLILKADDGMILTDGKQYGTEVYLEVGRKAEEFKEITRAEYDKIQEEEAKRIENEVM